MTWTLPIFSNKRNEFYLFDEFFFFSYIFVYIRIIDLMTIEIFFSDVIDNETGSAFLTLSG